jgi:predicted alpha-1,2-mannosidase
MPFSPIAVHLPASSVTGLGPGPRISGPASLVDVDVPTIREGIPFRGAAVPFGMVMFGPNDGQGYSLTCLQGAEVPGDFYGHVPFRPTTLPFDRAAEAEPIPIRNPKGAPGYFRDVLPDGIEVELTVSSHTGMARFTFPADAPQNVRFAATRWTAERDNRTLRGFHQKGLGYKVYFAAVFDRPFQRASGGVVGFDGKKRVLLMKVGMSYVSADNALANLRAENRRWDFDGLRRQASRMWDRALDKIHVDGGTPECRSMLATCLYRAFLQPNLFSDSNGDYLGFDGRIRRVSKAARYANYSEWDIYRTWAPLAALLEPKAVGDMMQTLVDAAKVGGGAMPRWTTANVETGLMEEASATPLIASAYAFGARDFDLESAWKAMDLAESTPGAMCQTTEAHPSLELFLSHGFMPQDDDYNRKRAASFTLEYGMAAFALSQFAEALGKGEAASAYLKRSQAWKNIFNSATGCIQSRNEDGSWFPAHFDPAVGHFVGFTEGNSAQYTWTVRHNMRALIDAAGGRKTAQRRLDGFFAKLNAGPAEAHCWIGNEPSLTIPWAYHWCGAPWETQRVVDRILNEVWLPGTIAGADDLGTLSAWYVWASIGLFPAIPGTDVLLLGVPQFDQVTLRLPNGRTLIVSAPGASAGRRYVRAVRWNGKPITASWVRAETLRAGGPLALSEQPDEGWASHPEDEPPSFDAPAPP